VSTSLGDKQDARIPTGTSGCEVFALLLASFSGDEEPTCGEGTLRSLRDVDRFRLSLEYADGTVDECLPLNVVSRRFEIREGVQVVVAAADASRQLRAVSLRDRTRQGAFAVAALSVRTAGTRLFPEAAEDDLPFVRAPAVTAIANRRLEVELGRASSPLLARLVERANSVSQLMDSPAPMVGLRVDGREIPAEQLRLVNADSRNPRDASSPVTWYGSDSAAELRLGLSIEQQGDDAVRICAFVRNDGPNVRTVSLTVPRVGPYRLGDEAQQAFYLVPRRGTVFDHRSNSFRERYCGTFPVQFLDTFCP